MRSPRARCLAASARSVGFSSERDDADADRQRACRFAGGVDLRLVDSRPAVGDQHDLRARELGVLGARLAHELEAGEQRAFDVGPAGLHGREHLGDRLLGFISRAHDLRGAELLGEVAVEEHRLERAPGVVQARAERRELGDQDRVAHRGAWSQHRRAAVEQVDTRLSAQHGALVVPDFLDDEATGQEPSGGEVQQDAPRITDHCVAHVLDTARGHQDQLRSRVAHCAKRALLDADPHRSEHAAHVEATVHRERGTQQLRRADRIEMAALLRSR
jgi:hypothetical protein